jgi:hypothetical protein
MTSSNKEDPSPLGKLKRSIRGAFDGPVERVIVRQLHADGTMNNVTSMAGEEISGKARTSDVIADDIFEQMNVYAQDFPGTAAKFVVFFYRPNDSVHARRSPAIVIRSKQEEGVTDEIEASEPATDRGVTSQSMRHLETRDAQLTRREGLVAQQSELLITRLSNMVQSLADVFPRVLEAEQGLIDRTQERSIRFRREEKTDKLVEKGLETVMMLAGPLAAKVLPGQGGAAIAQDMMLINLMSSMKPEQIQALMTTLTHEQQANFIELYTSLRKRYEKVQLAEKNPVETTSSNSVSQQDSAGTAHEPEANPGNNGATS